jgi:hypothetical protein
VHRILLLTSEGHLKFEDHKDLPVSVLQQSPGEAVSLSYDICDPKQDEEVAYPEDIPESELVEMLTECMGIVMIKNKVKKIESNLNKLEAPLPAAAAIRKRDIKRMKTESQEESGNISDNSEKYPIMTNPYYYSILKRSKR